MILYTCRLDGGFASAGESAIRMACRACIKNWKTSTFLIQHEIRGLPTDCGTARHYVYYPLMPAIFLEYWDSFSYLKSCSFAESREYF
jgi:hypothetical protein